MSLTTISQIHALPTSPFEGSGLVAIVITSGIPSYFRVTGLNLENIISVNWFPENNKTLDFEIRQLTLVDTTEGVFMIRVLDNHLTTEDRGGVLSFKISDGTSINYPVTTYGPVSSGPLWTPPTTGLITG